MKHTMLAVCIVAWLIDGNYGAQVQVADCSAKAWEACRPEVDHPNTEPAMLGARTTSEFVTQHRIIYACLTLPVTVGSAQPLLRNNKETVAQLLHSAAMHNHQEY